MIEKEINIGKLKILGQKCDESDNADLYSLFNSWLSFKNLSKKFRQRANAANEESRYWSYTA